MEEKIKVMITTEGTYPFHHGGVSTWCDMLVKYLNKDIDFVVYSIIMNPYVTQKFTLPNHTKLIKVPLWGTEEPSEHLDIPFSKFYISKKKTTDEIIENMFIPLFLKMIKNIVTYEKDPEEFGETLLELHRYFKTYEYKKSFKSEITWNAYKEFILKFSEDNDNNMGFAGEYAMIQSLGWIYRFMNILNTPIPDVDVTHSAAAAFCGIPCVLAKLENNTPYILTEHGVYLREQYLNLSQSKYGMFLNAFLIRMIHSVVSLNYFYADQVSPVCEYNTRWEMKLGVEKDRIKTIYNGVDKDIFKPETVFKSKDRPTVSCVARIDPVKDIITLIKSAKLVKDKIPNVKYIFYGSVTVQSYYEECLKLIEELELEDTFIIEGHTSDVQEAYKSGDIVALSSISEGFPYSVVEAMILAKPVISTDVGGVKEALGDTGILVEPRNPEAFAEGTIKLLSDVGLRATLGEEARSRALNYFTMDRIQKEYLQSYSDMHKIGDISEVEEDVSMIVEDPESRQVMLLEKGFALLAYGYKEEAIYQLKNAIDEDVSSYLVPAIMTTMADIYNELGEYDKALIELEKAEIFIELLDIKNIA